MNIDDFLARLTKVRPSGSNKFMACCPALAHDDKNPSLSISFNNEGIGVHCFAGCDKADILSAIGLDFTDLFFSEKVPYSKTQRNQFDAIETLKLMQGDAAVVSIAATLIRQGKSLSNDDMERLKEAEQRLYNACEVINAKFR